MESNEDYLKARLQQLEEELATYQRSLERQNQSYERSQAALQASEERFEMIADHVPQLVWTTQPDGYHDYFNRRWTEYTGLTLEDTRGWRWSHVLHPDDRERTFSRWSYSLATGEPYDVEYRLLRARDQTYRWFLGQALPVRSRQGDIVRWFGTCTDIHDQKQTESELAAAKQAAEEASQAKSQFLASMSHELRTPLNAIIGYSEMLQEEVDDIGATALSKDLAKIHSAGKHLLSLISDILDLSKIEAGKMDTFLEDFDIAEMLEDVVSTVEPLAAQNDNRLEKTLDPGLGRMHSDVTKVRQSLFNLLSNACKFTNNGRINLQVARFERDGRDWIEFQVIDTGAGISPEKLQQIFDPFIQAHKKESTGHAGTGLGLALTKNFCELLGGTITASSETGRGSIFTIHLPRSLHSTTASDEHRTAGAKTREQETRPKRNLVLVVDDDAHAQDLISRHLSREGFEVQTASSGLEALRLAKELLPNVITLDVLMPGLDGIAVLQALKSDPQLASIPVVMVSMTNERRLGMALGAADYVSKPVSRDRLMAIMGRYWCPDPPCRVLIVDDDETSIALMRAVFEKGGWEISEAANGAEALKMLERQKPTLILLDLIMPIMDGFEFTTTFRHNAQYADIPVVVLTAKDITAEDRARLQGAVEKVITKGSVTSEDLLKEVRQVIVSSS